MIDEKDILVRKKPLEVLYGVEKYDFGSQTELARKLDVQRSNMSRRISRLIDSGYLREVNPGSSRKTGQQLEVTEKGKKVLYDGLISLFDS